jgi:hypothetical protein
MLGLALAFSTTCSTGASKAVPLANAHACAEPVVLEPEDELSDHERFVRSALGMPPAAHELIAIRIDTAFEPAQKLALIRRRGGSYVIRSTRMTKEMLRQWEKMMMGRRQSACTHRVPVRPSKVCEVTATPTVRELPLDLETAMLLLRLSKALLARAQPVHELGMGTGRSGGVVHQFWHAGVAAWTHSPTPGSVLAVAVSAVERVRRVVDATSLDPRAELRTARDEMRAALRRTLRKESCLRPWFGQ